ncbi:transketolase [Lophiostoma macrostomum CBS 122681]|uniref:Transketolase n=1 Tax=Lophiostoma macrostomum CBS 122681 TaxID=1314788 RepID=A0A6A6SRD6_9PLEO|nr:transketolase [Lophiostoma macrostomum CBS 122681]
MAVEGATTASPRFRLSPEDRKLVPIALSTFRCFVSDLCEQYKGGHPGSAMGMAAIGLALWKYSMNYSPANPEYFNRDRFVLSTGHTCIFQYLHLHLTGYDSMTMDQLKGYHSSLPSLCPGHPEIEHPGIELTTGPLGQGIANAVGLAMATKHLAATYNQPHYNIANNMTWCIVGDACLQEGKLNNLYVIYNNNQVTCNGSVNLYNNEDVNIKMRAYAWNFLEIEDGSYDVEAIPTFINIRTVIGLGSKSAGDAKAHGAAFGPEDVASIKRHFGMDPEKHFVISDQVLQFYRTARPRGVELEQMWDERVKSYAAAFPQLYEEFRHRVEGKMTADWKALIPQKGDFPTSQTPSRKSAGLVCNPLAAGLKNMMVGTADLSPSVNMIWKGKVDFQHPDLRTTCGINGNYAGRAIASISNSLAAYSKRTILPITSTFFMFYIGLQQIHIATHDSIGTGEDDPTHQPIALAALYRAIPNILYICPCDSKETASAFIAALEAKVQKGAYIFNKEPNVQVTLLGVKSEIVFTVKTKKLLAKQFNIKARIVSFPSQQLFKWQSLKYKREECYTDARFLISSFGHSLPGAAVYRYFGFDENVKQGNISILRGEFQDLNPARH